MAISAYITGLQHIGLPTDSIGKTWEFYKTLGFEKLYERENVLFMEQKGLVIETYHGEKIAGKAGAWDHIAIDVSDIEKAYEEIHALGFRELEDGIQSMVAFENGVRYFTILGPNGEKVEFNQKL